METVINMFLVQRFLLNATNFMLTDLFDNRKHWGYEQVDEKNVISNEIGYSFVCVNSLLQKGNNETKCIFNIGYIFFYFIAIYSTCMGS